MKDKSIPVVDGTSIPKSSKIKPIFHIHGSINKPSSIILTEADYFKFSHRENYMSRKLFTLIQETTVVIMGYALGDFNLNRILNEAKELKLNTVRRSDIYNINRDTPPEIHKRFFYTTFGVSVLSNLEINHFLEKLNLEYENAKNLILGAEEIFPLVLNGEKKYSDEYLKLEDSFSHILLRANVRGIEFDTEELPNLIFKVLDRKKDFTAELYAWDQYEHLAHWLIHLGSLFEISGTKFEDNYIELVGYSFKYMSEELELGYSWKAHSIWKSNFQSLKPLNKKLIRVNLDPQFF